MNGLNKNLLHTALLAVTLCALPALAGPDTYGLGTGKDGALAPSAAGTVINAYAPLTAPAAPGDSSITVGTTTGFATNDLVMIMQMTGIVPEPPSGGPSPVDLTNDPVGRWELARLTGVTGSTMTLDVPLVNSYAANVTQVIRVPEYTTVTINFGRSITAPAWNGSTGGVVAFLANGQVTNLAPTGGIVVTGKGFRGGQPVVDSSGTTGCTGLDEPAQAGARKGEGIAATRYGPAQTGYGRVANGGGGGVCLNSGGGGGGNGGAGGQGGNSDLNTDGNRAVGGQGGAALTFDALNRLVMGGGGGAGHVTTGPGAAGGTGGGIIFARANTMTGTGSLEAKGDPALNSTGQDAASGGGAGGSIYLRTAGTAACGNLLVAGGNGGSANSGFDVGPGGSGGGGRILLQPGSSGTCKVTAISVIPGNPGVQGDSTAPGGASYGAQAGTAGSSTTMASGFPTTMPVPVVSTPANGTTTTNNKPTFSGTLAATGPAGTQVSIYVDGALVATVTPTGTSWTFTPTVALADGSHTVNAVAISTANAVQSTKSNTNTFSVDTTPPAAPVVSTPANGSLINSSKPVYTGTAEANSTVTVYVDGTAVGTATADASGNWSFTQPSALAQSSHTVKATAKDAAGNVSPDSNINTFTVDTTPPLAPVVNTPPDNSSTNNPRPVYTGTAEAGSTVTVYVDGTAVGTTTASATSTWSFVQPTALADGGHTVMATATDAAGNVSPDSNTNNFIIDTVSPVAPVVLTPADGSVINTNTPEYSGDAQGLAATVTVYVDGTPVGTASVIGGSWTFTQPFPLTDGVHTVMVISQDRAGNVSPNSNTNTFTVDTAPPAPPVVLTPADGSHTNNTTPLYTGTAEAGSTVTVYVDGTAVGTTTANASGAWSLTQPTALPEGSHSVKATATDTVGNVSGFSNTNTFTVDTTPPPAPVALTPANGSHTNNAKPTYTGTAEANTTVTVYVDGTAVGTTTANASGSWSFTPITALPEGSHSVKATATDAAGNVSVFSNTNTFTVDTTPPAAPVVSTPANGSRTTNTTPTYTGTAEAGATVTVYVDGTAVGTTTATAAGSWSFTQPTALPEGAHTVSATATDAAGNTSASSNTNTFTVDLTPPSAPVVVAPANGSSTNDTTPTYSGTAEPGSTVTVIVDGSTVGTATADSSGNWSFTPTTPLPEGSHSVRATATDVAGNTSGSSNTNTFAVDTTPPPAPVVVAPANGSSTNDTTPTYSGTAQAGTTVTVYVDGTAVGTVTADASGNWTFTPPTSLLEGSHSVKATSTDAAGNVSVFSNTNTFTVDVTPPVPPVVSTPANGSSTNDTTPTYSGTAEPGSTVTVIVDGSTVGTTTADSSGNWSFTPTTPLAEGSHTVSAAATDVAGNAGPANVPNTFTVDVTAPAAPVVSTPADGSHTNDTTPAYTGTAEAGSTVTVTVDGSVVGTTTAAANGSWSFTPTTPLAEGSHTVSATAADAAGNTSGSSNTHTFTVDLTPPAAPVVSTPANGAIINDNTPTYTGTAEAGSTVAVIVDGSVVGTTTASASGTWAFTPITGLTNGSHSVKATATDAAGNASPESNTNTFTVDATVPNTPVVTGPESNTVTNDSTPTFTGTADPNTTVTVILNGNPVGTATVDAAGHWTFTPTTPLSDGPYTLTVTSTSAAGNVSPASSPVRFTVDTAVPDTTIVSGPSGDTDSPNATFDFSSTENGVTYECSLDGAAFTACTDPFSLEGLADGGHTLQVRARDSAGNVDTTPASATWNVKSPAPSGDNLNFRGGGVGCASTGAGPSALAMMGLAVLSALMLRKRRQ